MALPQALSPADVTQVRVTVSASDIPTALSVNLTHTNGQWRGVIGNIPAGTQRTFAAQALGSDGAVLFDGQASGITITTGQTSVVALTLNPFARRPPSGNAAPIIDALNPSAVTVAPGGTVHLQALAHDTDAGDLLTYGWSAPAGTFGTPGGPSIDWTAPAFTGPVTLHLSVTDQAGAAAYLDLTIQVQAGTGSADTNIHLNTWPHISSLSVSPSPVALNQPATVSVTAGDNEGDALSYQWSASGCSGSWTGASTNQARFTPSALPAGGACSCQLSVTVADGNGGQVSRSLALCVQTTTQTPQPPVITSTFQSAATVPGGASVTLWVEAQAPQGGGLNFAWTANAGTLGTPTSGAGRSEIVWTAPACVPLGTTPAIQVTLRSANGLTTSYSFTVNGVLGCGPAGPRSSPWTILGGLAVPRSRPAAVLLPSGKVLIAGPDNTAELYEPVSNTSAPTRNMAQWNFGGMTLTLLPDGKVLKVGESTQAELYDPATEVWSSTNPRTTAGRVAALLPSGKVLVTGIANNGAAAELYDSAQGAWSRTGAMSKQRFRHTLTALPSGKVLVAGGSNNSDEYSFTSFPEAEIYDPGTGSWSATGSMMTPRAEHAAVRLSSGKILVVGGSYNGTPVATAELYDPATGTWSATGPMSTPRAGHTAVLLPSQKVLVAGGKNSGELQTAELYDPTTGIWSAVESMQSPHVYHAAVLLPSGKVLIAGGAVSWAGDDDVAGTLEVFDPATGHWRSTPFMPGAMNVMASSTVLPSDQVLFTFDNEPRVATFNPSTGQWTALPNSLNWAAYFPSMMLMESGKALLVSNEGHSVFDPATNTWSPRGDCRAFRPALVPLLSGKILIVDTNYQRAYLYEPSTNTCSTTGTLRTVRSGPGVTRLPSGKVLITGGTTSSGPAASAEVYDPASGTWAETAPMNTPHVNPMSLLLPSGKVLVAGGNSPNTVEVYDPGAPSWAPLSPAPFEVGPATLLPSGKVLVTGRDDSQAQIFDPSTLTWVSVEGLYEAGKPHLLSSGEVLFIRSSGSRAMAPALYTP